MTFQTSLSQVPDEQLARASPQFIVPLGDALAAQTQLSVMDWLIARMGHASRLADAQLGKGVASGRGPMRRVAPPSRALTLAEAQQQVREAGVEGRVKVFEGQREEALELEIEREQTKQKYEQIVAHADPGAGTQFLIGATGVAVDFADPVNVGTMLIPGVGAGRVVYGLTKATAKLAPVVSKIIVRAGTGAYEGAVSTALAEPLNYAVHQSLGDDYGWDDSLKNIGTNAIAGGVLHALGGLGLDLYRGMRMRPEAGAEGTIRVVGGGAEQIGSLEPIDIAGLLAREPAPVHAEQAPAVEPPTKKRTGSGYARNSILIMPAAGAFGERVTLRDLATFNAVRREYEPLRQAGANGRAGASAVDVYRIERNGEIIVYTQSGKVKGSPTTYTVERLRADDVANAGPLSKRSAAGASGTGNQADPLLYLHPPKALAERLSETLETTVTELERLTPEELHARFRPGEMAGHTIDTQIGNTMHGTYEEYAMGSEELRVIEKEGGALPDSEVENTELLSDLKRDSPRGRRNAQETRRKYWERLNRDTVFPLYDVKLHADRIAALNEKVVKAWDQFQPNWRKELAARKEAEKAQRVATAQTKTPKNKTMQNKTMQKKTTQTTSTQRKGTAPKKSKQS